MKKSTKLLMAGSAVIAFSAGLSPDDAKAASQVMNINVDLVPQISLSEQAALDFGNLITANNACTIAIDTSDTVTDNAPNCVAAGGSPASGVLRITQAGAASLQVNVLAGDQAGVSITDGVADTLTVGTFQLESAAPAVGPSANTITVTPTAGQIPLDVSIGATLNVPLGGNADGAYTGTFTMEVNYN